MECLQYDKRYRCGWVVYKKHKKTGARVLSEYYTTPESAFSHLKYLMGLQALCTIIQYDFGIDYIEEEVDKEGCEIPEDV